MFSRLLQGNDFTLIDKMKGAFHLLIVYQNLGGDVSFSQQTISRILSVEYVSTAKWLVEWYHNGEVICPWAMADGLACRVGLKK